MRARLTRGFTVVARHALQQCARRGGTPAQLFELRQAKQRIFGARRHGDFEQQTAPIAFSLSTGFRQQSAPVEQLTQRRCTNRRALHQGVEYQAPGAPVPGLHQRPRAANGLIEIHDVLRACGCRRADGQQYRDRQAQAPSVRNQCAQRLHDIR